MTLSGKVIVQALSWPLLGAVLLVLVHAGAIPAYQTYSVGVAATYTIVVLSVGLLAGWAGVWSVGHPALFAIGAYAAAHGSAQGWSLERTALVAALVAGLAGAFLGFAGARFSVLYIALLTLAFTLVVVEVINQWTSVTGGDQGVPVSELRSVLGIGTVIGGGVAAIDIAIVLAAVLLAVAVLARPTGMRIRMTAAKTDPMAARSVGIAPEAQTTLAFGVSGAATGLAGVLLGMINGFVSPETFALHFGINTIAAAVLGGVGTIAGAVVGGAFLTWAPSLAEAIGINQLILQGGLLILALLFLPGGTVPAATALGRRLVGGRWRRSHPDTMVSSEQPPATADREAADGDDSTSSSLLEVDDLRVVFGGLKALDGVSFQLRRGEILGIIGPNGAGKTTLVNVLSGLAAGGRVTGSVRHAGSDLRRTRATSRRRRGIGRTFQHAELFSQLTTVENVLCAHRWISLARRAEAIDLLSRVGLADVADRMPLELPFGLQKRLDLARALAEAPSLLVLDEPFGGLDTSERELLAERIRQLRSHGVSVVIIDHVIEDLFAVADRILAFDFGRPIGSGLPEEILRDPTIRASYLGTSSGRPSRPAVEGTGEPMITLSRVGHHYGGVVALRGIDLDVREGEVLAVAGANGAGKSTLGQVLHGSLTPSDGQRSVARVGGRSPRSSLVPEGRGLFSTLSVRENLEVAGYAAGFHGRGLQRRLEQCVDWLPERVRNRLGLPAGALSGGEQQLLATARGLMPDPRVIILDEPALGLAPALVDEVYERIGRLAETGVTIVLLEQLLSRAMSAANRIVVLHEGSAAATGTPTDQGFAERAEAAYFGRTPAEAMDAGPATPQPS